MNCESARSQMLDLLDGELPADAAAVVRAHVDACEGCTRERAQLDAAAQLARRMPREAPSPSVRLAVLARARAVAAETPTPKAPTSTATRDEESGVARFLRWVSGFVLGPQVAMAMVLLLMVGVGLFYLPGLRRDRAVEGGAIVNADPGDEAGPSATIQPAAPLDLRLDTRTNRLQPAAGGAEESDAPVRAANDDSALAASGAVAAAAAEGSPAATLVAGAVTEAPDAVVVADEAALEGAPGRTASAARPSVASLAADATDRVAAAPAAEERVDEDLAPRGPMLPAEPLGNVAQARPAAAQVADDALAMARRERSVEAPAPSSPARASSLGGGALARGTGAGSITSAAPSMPAASASMGTVAGPLPTAGAATVRPPAALHATARAQAQSGQTRAAIAAYESLLAGHPSYERAPEAMLELAELHRRVGDLTSARAWIARAERSPSYAARARAVRTRIDEVERAPAAAQTAPASE